MLTGCQVSNFKSISEKTEIELAPLTIFAGANSSGKSSAVQPILVLAQTMQDKVQSRPIIFDGQLTDLGEFADIKSRHNENTQITIACKFSQNDCLTRTLPSIDSVNHDSNLTEMVCEISLDSQRISIVGEEETIVSNLIYTNLEVLKGDQKHAYMNNYRSIDESWTAAFAPIQFDQESKLELQRRYITAIPKSSTLTHFLPNSVNCEIDLIKEKTIVLKNLFSYWSTNRKLTDMLRVIPNNTLNLLEFTLSEIICISDCIDLQLPDDKKISFKGDEKSLSPEINGFKLVNWLNYIDNCSEEIKSELLKLLDSNGSVFDAIESDLRKSKTESRKVISVELPESILRVSEYISNYFLTSVKYLGPLRDPPKTYYKEVPALDFSDVGIRGENTAAVYEANKNANVTYISPVTLHDKLEFPLKYKEAPLADAVAEWLSYMGVANSMSSRDRGILGHELTVNMPNSEYQTKLTHVGVGVSQVLPILVNCLLANNDSTIVLEQPEIHLHPRIQTYLCDFFVSIMLSNKQCLVETHSEYIVDRLRYWFATIDSSIDFSSLAAVYFFEKPELDSKISKLTINKYGVIENWPVDFFAESANLAEKIMTAAFQRDTEPKGKHNE